MPEWLGKFLLSFLQSFFSPFLDLLVPALIFFLLAFLVKKNMAFNAIWKAMPDGFFNVSCLALNVVVFAPVLNVISHWVSLLEYSLIPLDFWEKVPGLAVVFLAVFLGDFVGYWRHRFEHTKLLWPAHFIHHSDENMTWLTLERFHPLNRLSTFLIDNSILLLVGFPPYALIANNLIRHYYGFFIHADLPWTYGFWGRFFVSPAMHRWHHALDSAYHHTNFATVFSLFDRVFGTYKVPGECCAPLGCLSKGRKLGFWRQQAHPFLPSSYY